MLKALFVLSIIFMLSLAACQPVGLVHEMDAARSGIKSDDNIVLGVISAPTVSNGILAGHPTTINILLNAPGTEDRYASDPMHFGHQIPAGGRMEIELGGSFIRSGVDNDAELVEINSNNNLILLAGNPQNVIVTPAGNGPQHGNYRIEDDGERTITVYPNGGEGDNGIEGARAEEIGIKGVWIASMLGSDDGPDLFQNGAAGEEGTVSVRIYAADGTIRESGEASVIFPASIGRRVVPTNFGLITPMMFDANVSTDLIEATNFQRVSPGAQLVNSQRGETFSANAPYSPRFLLLESVDLHPESYFPMLGIPNVGLVVDADRPSQALVIQDTNEDGVLDEMDEAIGTASISGPNANSAGQILTLADAPLTGSGNGVDFPPGGILNVPVAVGDSSGIYEVVVTLDNGEKATVFLVAE